MTTDNSSRIERTAAAWLARRDAREWDARDQAQLEAWLDDSEAHRVAWLRLLSAWQQADRLKALGAGVPAGHVPPRGQWNLSSHFDARHAQAREHAFARQRATRRRHAFAAAAMLALTLTAATAVFLWRSRIPPAPPAIYSTTVGQSASVSLADGSEATLSSNTRIAVELTGGERDIALERGEAYFEVKKDAGHPFVVHADGRRVVAVGTRFAVRRDDAADLRVVVTQGLVRLEPPPGSGAATTLLPPGSVAQVSGDALEVRHLPLEDARELLSWRDGFVVFHDTPLADAVEEFNRYNTRKLAIADPSIANLRVGGHFRWSNDQAFVRLIEQVFPVRAEVEGDRIVLLGKRAEATGRKHASRD